MVPFLMSLLAFVCVLSPLVFLHELGHYWAAKACGVHVERFSIGFGPKIVSWKDRAGTEWIISWILLGGYVQMMGDGNVASTVAKDVPNIDVSKTMAGKSHLQRIAIAAAGPGVNYLLAFVMLIGLMTTVGDIRYSPTIGETGENSYAYQSGLRAHDRIIRMQDQPIETFEDISAVLGKTTADQPLTVMIERDDRVLSLMCAPIPHANGFWMGKLGIGPDQSSLFYEKQSLGKALDLTLVKLDPIRMLKNFKLSSMGGPIHIARQSGHVWQQGWIPVLFFMAYLSLGLGFFNLLPLPVLDGGMIVMEMLEWVIGRPLSTRLRQGVSIMAVGLLITLMLILSWSDLVKIPAVATWVQRFMG